MMKSIEKTRNTAMAIKDDEPKGWQVEAEAEVVVEDEEEEEGVVLVEGDESAETVVIFTFMPWSQCPIVPQAK